jgi:heptosyltransferase-3
MPTVLQRLPMGARVAVIRLRSLGDCVLSTPALQLLKQARPDLEIGVVAEDVFAAVFAGNPDVSRVLPPHSVDIVRWRPKLVLNLHGGARSARLTLASRAAFRAGFDHFRFRPLYNIRIPTAQQILGVDRKVHTAEHVASAMFHLGVPVGEVPRARLFAAPRRWHRPYAVLHPFASVPAKTWSSENFRTLASFVEEHLGLEPVFVAGPGESLGEFRPWRCVAGVDLEDTKSLLAGASLFAGNDSGPAHMAAALGLPCLVLFGASDPEVWGPWKTPARVLHSPQINAITPSQAAETVQQLAKEASFSPLQLR